jgi:D-galactarolactone isomerase
VISGAASSYLAPHSAGTCKPNFSMPAGACDAHMHLFDNRYPFAAGVQLVHADASVDDYRQLQGRLGTERCVIVQPSSYGHDHRVLLDGLKALGDSARGIAVIDPDVTEQKLNELQASGIVGVRFNLVQRGATNEGMLKDVAERIKELNWHLQLHLLPEDFLRLADQLCDMSFPIVLDHFARVQTVPELAHQVEKKVIQLLNTGLGWIKFSGAYIASFDEPDYKNLDQFVSRLIDKHSDRIIWGSDWPHVTESAKPDDAHLANFLQRWMPEKSIRKQVLVENPAKLYGFDASL